MLTLRSADARGHTNIDWLDSRHSFSFGNYYDPQFLGYRSLRVINDDRITPGASFGTHGHRDMEIVTFVLDGALAHKDSLGNGTTIHPGEIQRMSAGTGIQHSEFNASEDLPAHFLQIWFLPAAKGTPPGYEQKHYDRSTTTNRFGLIGSHDGRDGTVRIGQDVNLYCANLAAGHSADLTLPTGRHGWVHVATGDVRFGDQALAAGDGGAWNQPLPLQLTASQNSTILLFDLA